MVRVGSRCVSCRLLLPTLLHAKYLNYPDEDVDDIKLEANAVKESKQKISH